MQNFFINIFDLFFPNECLSCNKLLEKKGIYLCFSCFSDLPLTRFSNQAGNELEKSFKGRIPLVAATSLLLFENKGMVQKIVHQLKYHQKPKIGRFFGNWLAEEMVLSKRFEAIDYIVPVPLHPDKEKKRGYNQVHLFAESMSVVLKIEFSKDALIKIKNKRTQTLKNRQDRILPEKSPYIIKDVEHLKNKHILLVDDVITSGATMQACADSLLCVPGLKLSLASMAFTP